MAGLCVAKRNRGVDSIVSGLSMLSTHTLNFNSFIGIKKTREEEAATWREKLERHNILKRKK